MYEQNKNINKKIKIIKRKQIEILALMSIFYEIKISLGSSMADLNRKKIISYLKTRKMEIIQSRNKRKRIKKSE